MFTKYTKVPRLELSHEYKRLEILAKFTKSKDFKKRQKHKPVLINVIRCFSNNKFSASLLTYTNSTRMFL